MRPSRRGAAPAPKPQRAGLLTCLIEVLGQLRTLPAARLAGDDEEWLLADSSHQGPPVAADGQRAALHGGGGRALGTPGPRGRPVR